MNAIRLFFLSVLSALPVAAQSVPVVVTSNQILKDLVTQIGGDAVQVECLLPPGADPADYEPTDANARRLADAALLVVNGAGLEPWLADFIKRAGYEGPVVVATTGVSLLDIDGQLHEPKMEDDPDPEPEGFNPYAWHDPRNVIIYVSNIRGALVSLVKGHTTSFNDHANTYVKQLETLQTYATDQLATIPPARHKLVTPLDALNYIGHAYGFSIVRTAGLASGLNVPEAQLERLGDVLTRSGAPAAFFEPTANPMVLRRLSAVSNVKAIASLHIDDLGAAGTPAATYLGMFRANIDAIVSALK